VGAGPLVPRPAPCRTCLASPRVTSPSSSSHARAACTPYDCHLSVIFVLSPPAPASFPLTLTQHGRFWGCHAPRASSPSLLTLPLPACMLTELHPVLNPTCPRLSTAVGHADLPVTSSCQPASAKFLHWAGGLVSVEGRQHIHPKTTVQQVIREGLIWGQLQRVGCVGKTGRSWVKGCMQETGWREIDECVLGRGLSGR
jgi:hypothetical protein